MTRSIVAAAIVTAVFANSATAQEEPFELPPLVLGTALRDDRDILDTPVATSVLEGEALEERQADTFEELIGDIPGVLINGGPRGVAQEPNIRGFNDEQVVLRFDGGRLNFNRAHSGRFFFDPDIVQRVEVVRGGGSTLFGSGALGGVISVETKDPDDLLRDGQTTGARVRLGYSTNGEIFSPSVTVFGDYGAFDALAFIGGREASASLDDGNGDDIARSEIDSINGLLKFGFEPSADQRFELALSYYEDEGFTPAAADAPATFGADGNDSFRESEIFTYRLSYDWNPEGNDLIDLSLLLYGNTLDISDDRTRDGRFDQTSYDTIGFEAVNRSSFDAGIPVDLVYGIEVFRDEQEGTRDGAARVQFPDATADTYGVFVEATLGLSDQFDLILGARFDSYSRDVDDPSLADADDEFFSPRIGFSYRPNDNWQIFGNVARAFRAPTLTELYNDGTHFEFTAPVFAPTFFGLVTNTNSFVPTPDLEPEESTQVELGARFEAAGRFRPGDVLRFSANAYYAKVDNFIDTFVSEPLFADFVPSTFPGPIAGTVATTTTNRNVDAELYGVEFELDYDAGNWFAGLGLSLPQGSQTNGEALGALPQHRLVTTFGYRPTSDITVGLRATFAAEQDDVPATSVTADSYTVVDLFGSWTPSNGPLEGAVLRAGIDNIFDEQYTIFPNDLPQAGRTFRVSATFAF
ncbi:MAG: TonB-dependent hemoglobin/transferrin/lactoferrin family receptor [Pseudomonadota bacterium]